MKCTVIMSLALRGNAMSTTRSASGVALRMKAAIVSKHGGALEVIDVPVPEPKTGEVLVRIRRSGCCHTDVHAIDGDWPVKSKLPLCPGHEGAGEVVSVGPNVVSPKVGERVGIAWLHSACGRCEFCISGWETLCTRQQNSGYSVDGNDSPLLGCVCYIFRRKLKQKALNALRYACGVRYCSSFSCHPAP